MLPSHYFNDIFCLHKSLQSNSEGYVLCSTSLMHRLNVIFLLHEAAQSSRETLFSSTRRAAHTPLSRHNSRCEESHLCTGLCIEIGQGEFSLPVYGAACVSGCTHVGLHGCLYFLRFIWQHFRQIPWLPVPSKPLFSPAPPNPPEYSAAG